MYMYRDELSDNGVEMFDKVNEWRTCDGTMRGFQSEDFDTYSTEKDRDRYVHICICVCMYIYVYMCMYVHM
jgi:hypothetical protein